MGVQKSRSARVRQAAAAVVLAGIGLHIWQRHRPPPRAPDAPASIAVVDPAPVEPARWQLGKVKLRACSLRSAEAGPSVAAWCGVWRVPENRADPAGRQLDLRLAIVRSDAQAPASDMVTLLAGGPGQAATEVWPQLSSGLAGLLEHRDVLLLDQRGTGGSNPLTCHDAADSAPAPAALDLATVQTEARRCADQLAARADLRMYTTTIAAQDLEDVRQALGSPALDLIGISYGTRLAQRYASAYPAAVRSIVLDGVVPNELALGQEHAANLEAALQAQSQRCEADPSCRRRFGDPYASLQQLSHQLQAQPQQLSVHDPYRYTLVQRRLDAGTLALVARMFAYSPLTMAVLPLSVDAARHGDAGPLMAQAELLHGTLEDSMSSGMGYSISCAEDADLLHDRPQDAGTLLGNRFVDVLQAICAGWPRGQRPADFHKAFHSEAPVLLLSGQYDPVTPPRYAQAVAAGLPHARSLVLAGQGHNVILVGCTPRLVASFLQDADVTAVDDACLKDLKAPPFFTSFNGAEP
ncbi:alpha/beta hydrolase [Frateuria aurantia]